MYTSLTATEIKKHIGKISIIDIRDNYLYRLGAIPTAKNIPMNFLLKIPENYLNKDQTYYIYCASGMISGKVCDQLSKKGYKTVNILGGYNEYITK